MHEFHGFRDRVYAVVSQIPAGKVMSYGQIAALCGNVRAARIVGGIAHNGPVDLPWHRVVSKWGYVATGYPGGVEGHKRALKREGVAIKNLQICMKDSQWQPHL